MSTSQQFRVCPTTGLKIYSDVQSLIKANAVAAVIFLAIGGLFGLSVALTRWPSRLISPIDFMPASFEESISRPASAA